ncbi:MAG: 2Fe-2S iron-sulfur cluster binding domain-containing protein [Brevundimonas sp.]|nr:MAG: 2Fe-2S iron-sulfur cluster binding domain-containing protein [Brevundimonas sp.]
MRATITLANGVAFDAIERRSILDSAAAANVILEYSCKTGRCGVCRAHVTSGHTIVLKPEISLTPQDTANGVILTCCREAESELALDIEDVSALAGIEVRTTACRIDTLEPLADDVLRVTLRLPPQAPLAFLPGQHVQMIRGELRRSYSIANAPRADGRLELIIKRVPGGAFSGYWFDEARPNDLLRLEGPLGTFFLREDDAQRTVMLATGTGLAPVLAMLEQIKASGGATRPVTLYWGGRRPEDLCIDVAAIAPWVDYRPCLSRADDGWSGLRGYVQDELLREKNLAETVIYACGSTAMIDDARAALVARGLPERRFHSDAFVQS